MNLALLCSPGGGCGEAVLIVVIRAGGGGAPGAGAGERGGGRRPAVPSLARSLAGGPGRRAGRCWLLSNDFFSNWRRTAALMDGAALCALVAPAPRSILLATTAGSSSPRPLWSELPLGPPIVPPHRAPHTASAPPGAAPASQDTLPPLPDSPSPSVFTPRPAA